MILCITEKPSVGADIAKILGATQRRDGYFEGKDYCVTWTFGHLCELKDPSDYTDEWKKWSLATLPMIPQRFGIKVKDDKGIKKQFKVIENLIKKCDRVINCGDAGQEGELIQRWVMQKAGCKKPVQRLWISSLTDESIRSGFKNLRPEKDFESLYMAGLCRAIGDWVLGMNATRLYTLKYSQRDKKGKSTILSIGRVQTPTLALIVDRQKEIENFVPTTSYQLQTKYRNVVFTSDMEPFKTQADGQSILRQVGQCQFEIVSINKKKTSETPPKLFDLTSLQIEANKKFGMSADETLKTIQSLYEKKLTTYPRVDTTYLTDDMYPKCMGILNSLKQYETFVQPLCGTTLKKSKKVFDNSKVTDHHAIIPTGLQPRTAMSDNESIIYDLIAKRFISVFLPDCIYDQTQVKGKAANVAFKTSSKSVSSPGWRSVYGKDAMSTEGKEDGELNAPLPNFAEGEKGPHSPFLAKKVTTPPSYYTEGTLLKAMETAGSKVDDEDLAELLKENGIGRPSTRAAIIEILYKRGYIKKQSKSIRATDAGIKLISLIKNELLKSAKLTGIWEGRLRAIERGEYSAPEFINQLKQMICEIINSVK